MMTPPKPRSPDSLRYFAVAVLCVAVLLGIYFVQLNAKVDRQREQTVEYLALCRQVERVASAASANRIELSDTCKQLSGQSSKSLTPKSIDNPSL
ncbi:hypothetical protein PVE_R1G2717 [Pseudomonas veronii 1YdBTEX2]|jgi:hypothetical protein|uniref:Uncharacterized protein n=1 Tax=Pseudomonas veronii 1YdBTEX2 TaxID=1295141 RepID=A0A1D3JXC7_PSEVE|nr:hypothetical protein [Pseudomonas veronii]SBW80601.1 hypothetical protein PVE_R1G2717 [Pseudomonas veronii 1YdBTEX2]